jgi:hypothetical protein
MPHSPPPPERPAKAADQEVKPGSVSRFKALGARLFGVDREEFLELQRKDEEERRAKRGGPSPSTRGAGDGHGGE